MEDRKFSQGSEENEVTIDTAIATFKMYLVQSTQEVKKEDIIDPQGNLVEAFIRTIANFIEQSHETTLQGLNISIKKTKEQLFKKLVEEEIIPKGRSTLSLEAVGEVLVHLLNKHTSKKTGEDFTTIKKNLVAICRDLQTLSLYAKEKIRNFFSWSVKNGMILMVHGYSSTIMHTLVQLKKRGFTFTVYITEGRPENSGEKMVSDLEEYGIDCKVILDISIGFYMKDIDCVLVGADAVCENGGVINKMGTFTLAICAKNFKKPFYVMVESLKFLKIYPLDQTDIPQSLNKYTMDSDENNPKTKLMTICDYTPPEFITLLFTDMGIFTPSAVSDELIQMFYN